MDSWVRNGALEANGDEEPLREWPWRSFSELKQNLAIRPKDTSCSAV